MNELCVCVCFEEEEDDEDGISSKGMALVVEGEDLVGEE